MAPSADSIERALYEKVVAIFNSDERDQLAVNLVRKRVAEEEALDEQYLDSDKWKQLSKKIIKETYAKLLEDEEKKEESKAEVAKSKGLAPKKRGTKRQSPEPDEQESPVPKKKQKKTKKQQDERKSKKTASKQMTVSDDEDKPAPKAKQRGRPKKKPVLDTEDEDGVTNPTSKEEEPIKQPPRESKPKKIVLDDDESLSDPPGEKDEPKSRFDSEPSPKKANPRLQAAVSDDDDLSDPPTDESDPIKGESMQDKDGDKVMTDVLDKAKGNDHAGDDEGEDSDISIVIDTVPVPRKKGKGKRTSKGAEDVAPTKEKKKRTSKGTTSKKDAPALSESEQQIKKYQQQLLKCGIRKIWAFELKQYGDNTRAKIKHLKSMLEDIGMTGRFSEAKAAQIKEQRELMADLEAVQEAEKHWGVGGTASRPKRGLRNGAGTKPKYSIAKESEDDDNEEEEESETAKNGSTRWRDQQAALAALLDDDEDSD